jgi:hypothetical protein
MRFLEATMLQLHEIQRAFADALINGNHQAMTGAILTEASALRHVALYRRLIRTNYTQVLAVTYPVLRRFVGPRYFDLLARGYLKKYSSTSGDLFSYGKHLPVLLLALQVPRLLVELARLEWACHEVYQAADSLPLSQGRFDAIASADPSRVVLGLSPGVRLLRLSPLVHRVWLALQPNAQANLVADLSPQDEETGVVVIRAEGSIHVTALAVLDYRLVEAMADRKTVAEIEQIATQCNPRFDFARFMASVVELGLLGSIDTEVRL